jgi:hypothetical protein
MRLNALAVLVLLGLALQPRLGEPGLVTLERVLHGHAHVDGAPAATLWGPEVAGVRDRALDPHLAARKVQVIPLESQSLPDPEAAPGHREEQGVEPGRGSQHPAQESRKLPTVERLDLLLAGCLGAYQPERLAKPVRRVRKDHPVVLGGVEHRPHRRVGVFLTVLDARQHRKGRSKPSCLFIRNTAVAYRAPPEIRAVVAKSPLPKEASHSASWAICSSSCSGPRRRRKAPTPRLIC